MSHSLTSSDVVWTTSGPGHHLADPVKRLYFTTKHTPLEQQQRRLGGELREALWIEESKAGTWSASTWALRACRGFCLGSKCTRVGWEMGREEGKDMAGTGKWKGNKGLHFFCFILSP